MIRSGARRSGLCLILAVFLCLPGFLACSAAADTLQLKLVRAVFLQSGGARNLSGMALDSDGWLYFCDDNGPAPPDWRLGNPVILRVRLDSVLDSSVSMPVLEELTP